MKNREVVFLSLGMAHFRIPFMNRVREILKENGVRYRLIFGSTLVEPDLTEFVRAMPWSETIHNRRLSLFGQNIYWQPVLSLIKSSDLTVIGQENKLLINLLLQLRHILGLQKIAFFGHGINFQSMAPNGLRAKVTKLRATRVDWWFAYNDLTAEVIKSYGFPAERITSIENAIDTAAIQSDIADISDAELEQLKQSLGIDSENVGIYIGKMYPKKRLPFLIEAAKLIRSRVPDFHLLLIGSGRSADVVESASRELDYIHYLGARYGREKSAYAKLSKVFLLPGIVGLAVLDSFAYRIPMVTTAIDGHGPEIDYLRPDENGLIVNEYDNVEKYAEAVSRVLVDEPFRNELIAAGDQAASHYTIENMAQNFCEGVLKALGRESPMGASVQVDPANQ